MRGFRFRLNGLLHLAQAEAQDRRQELEAANEVLRQAQDREVAAARARQAAEDAWRRARSGPVPFSAWLERQEDAESSRRVEQAASTSAEAQRREVEERQARYLSAHIDERRLEQLRTRQRRRWQAEAARQDQQVLDDIAGVLHERGEGGGAGG